MEIKKIVGLGFGVVWRRQKKFTRKGMRKQHKMSSIVASLEKSLTEGWRRRWKTWWGDVDIRD